MTLTTGERIRKIRTKQGLTQDQVAEKVGVKRANFSNYEADRTVPPSDVLGKIAKILHTSADYLLGNTENPDSPASEFLSKLDLSDDDLMDHFQLILDGKELTPEETITAIAVLRAHRQIRK